MKYIIALIIIFFLSANCSTPEPIVISSIINSCLTPSGIEYYEYNDPTFNDEIDLLVQKWPVHLQEYLHLKINNRIIQHERCKSFVLENIAYQNCLVSLIELQRND